MCFLNMIIEIEYYKGDATLYGKRLDMRSLHRLLKEAEKCVCGNSCCLTDMLCRYYGFEKVYTDKLPDWVYDRDTGLLYAPKG